MCTLPVQATLANGTESTADPLDTPAAADRSKKYIYETKEEAKEAFKNLMREKVVALEAGVLGNNEIYWRSGVLLPGPACSEVCSGNCECHGPITCRAFHRTG